MYIWLLSQILLSIMMTVWSKKMFVNRDFPSKDRKLWPVGIFSDFTLLVGLTLLATAYCNLLSGENNLARCLAGWHDTAPIRYYWTYWNIVNSSSWYKFMFLSSSIKLSRWWTCSVYVHIFIWKESLFFIFLAALCILISYSFCNLQNNLVRWWACSYIFLCISLYPQ